MQMLRTVNPMDENKPVESYVVPDKELNKYEYIMRRRSEGAKMQQIADELGVSLQYAYKVIRQNEGRATKWDGYKAPGRPKGAKDKKPRKPKMTGVAFPSEHRQLVDPATGAIVTNTGLTSKIIARMGDERVTAFVQYHIDMLKMREGCDKKNVPDLYNRFYTYLTYCSAHGIVPNNMNAYFAIGLTSSDISFWRSGKSSTPEQQKFAQDITQFFASIHEQGVIDGMFNPISGIFWQKAHDGMIEAQKLEVVNSDPLGEKKSAEDIVKKYEEVDLPT